MSATNDLVSYDGQFRESLFIKMRAHDRGVFRVHDIKDIQFNFDLHSGQVEPEATVTSPSHITNFISPSLFPKVIEPAHELICLLAKFEFLRQLAAVVEKQGDNKLDVLLQQQIKNIEATSTLSAFEKALKSAFHAIQRHTEPSASNTFNLFAGSKAQSSSMSSNSLNIYNAVKKHHHIQSKAQAIQLVTECVNATNNLRMKA